MKKTQNRRAAFSRTQFWMLCTTIIIVVLSGGIFFGWQHYRIHQEKTHFAQAAQDIQSMAGSMVQSLGKPALITRQAYCSRPNREAFARPGPLSCTIGQYLAYAVSDAQIATRLMHQSLQVASSQLRTSQISNAPFTDDALLPATIQPPEIRAVRYQDDSVSGLNCAISYQYYRPQDLQGAALFNRTRALAQTHALVVEAYCSGSASRPYYALEQ